MVVCRSFSTALLMNPKTGLHIENFRLSAAAVAITTSRSQTTCMHVRGARRHACTFEEPDDMHAHSRSQATCMHIRGARRQTCTFEGPGDMHARSLLAACLVVESCAHRVQSNLLLTRCQLRATAVEFSRCAEVGLLKLVTYPKRRHWTDRMRTK